MKLSFKMVQIFEKNFGSKFYYQGDVHSSPDFILQLIIVIEIKINNVSSFKIYTYNGSNEWNC